MILAKIPPSLRRVIAKKRRSTRRFLRYRGTDIRVWLFMDSGLVEEDDSR